MAVTQSPRLGLTRWGAGTDPLRRAQLDADNAALDDLVAIATEGLFNDRPAAGTPRRFYFATDDQAGGANGTLYYDDGTAWRQVNRAAADLTPYVKADRTRNPVPVRMFRNGKDANGIFTNVQEHRVDTDALATRSVLSGGVSPTYATRTVTEYDLDGVTVLRTTVYTLTYDSDGALISENVT